MNERDFNKLYLGSFEPDQKYEDLYKRLEQYYRDTPDSMSNKDALPLWREFKKWCSDGGYTQDEINAVKRRFRG